MTEPEGKRRSLDQRLQELPEEFPPARDLWPDIAARIADPNLQAGTRAPAARAAWESGWPPLAAAAAVAMLAVLGIRWYFGDDQLSRDPPPTAVLAPEGWSTFGPAYALGSGYHAARAGLTDDLEQRLDALPEETRATVQENLATIRRAVAEINAALGEDPSNVLLQHQLLAAYQDELTVLAHLNRVTQRLPQRNEI